MLPRVLTLVAQSSSVPLQWLDVLVLATSVVGVTAFGMWIGRKEDNTTDYYLAGKTVAVCWECTGSLASCGRDDAGGVL